MFINVKFFIKVKQVISDHFQVDLKINRSSSGWHVICYYQVVTRPANPTPNQLPALAEILDLEIRNKATKPKSQ